MQVLKEGDKVPDFKTVFKKIILGDQEGKKKLDHSKIEKFNLDHDAVDSPKMQQYNFESDVNCSKAINCNLENVIVDFSKAQNYNVKNVSVYSSNLQKGNLKNDVDSWNEKQEIGTGIINQEKPRRFSRKFEKFPKECMQRHYKKEKCKVKMKQTDEIMEKINHILDESSCFSVKKKLPDAYLRDYGEYEEPVSGLRPNKFSKIFEGSGINPYSQKKCNIPNENVSEFCANADYIFRRKKGETFVSDDKTPDKEKFCTDSRQNSKPSCFYFSKTHREFIEKQTGVQSCHHINEFSQNSCNKLLESLSISSSHQNTELNIYKSSVFKMEQNMQNSPLLNVSESDNQHFSEEWEIDEYLGVYGAPPEKILTKFPRQPLQWKK